MFLHKSNKQDCGLCSGIVHCVTKRLESWERDLDTVSKPDGKQSFIIFQSGQTVICCRWRTGPLWRTTSASESRMGSSLGSLLRNKQLKKAFFSWPLGQRRSISARSSNGFWAAKLKSCSTRWMSVSCCAANRRRRSFVYVFARSGSASTSRKTISRYCPFNVVITPLMQSSGRLVGKECSAAL